MWLQAEKRSGRTKLEELRGRRGKRQCTVLVRRGEKEREQGMAGVGAVSVLPENAVVVAVRAEREISKTALAWALTHVVRPGDFVTLLAVICNHDKGHRRRFWSFPKFSGDCSNSRRGGSSEDSRKCEVSASCSQMALQFHGFQDQNEVNMRIKVVVSTEEASPGSKCGGAVVAESKRVGANWIVLDRQLKQEAKHCMQELPHCSVVLMKRSHAKVLRLNLGGAAPLQKIHPPVPTFTVSAPGRAEQPNERHRREEEEVKAQHRAKHSTPRSSSQEEEPLTPFLREDRASSSSSSTATGGSSSFFVCEQNPLYEGLRGPMLRSKEESAVESFGSPLSSTNPWLECCQTGDYRDSSSSCTDLKRLRPPNSNPYWSPPSGTHGGRHVYGAQTNQVYVSSPLSQSIAEKPALPFVATRSLQENSKLVESDQESVAGWIAPLHEDNGREYAYKSGVRDAVSLFGNSPSIPPPLCSICRHKAPVFGKPPRWFRYEELEEATGGFSEVNFLAEGGFGWVHRGVLRDGQVVAVKRMKTAGGPKPKGDDEFRAEVEVLSRAQHRNVVMLVGFCVEGTRRVLVYEFICNGSLATHLYGRNKPPLDWHARYRIAAGAARGLRYLHEDCRVGFIHRDVRPNNILLTHDFEPLVGDFGLARWQMEDNSMDTRIIGTFGYLAPEYIESGIITEKADVYAFGVVLLELITGRRAMDMGRPKGQQFLTEWARPVLALVLDGDVTIATDRLLDPRLDADQTRLFSHQLNGMACAASLCLRREPQARPSMSKVLRLLEGETMVDPGFRAQSKDSRSARFGNPVVNRYGGMKGSLSQRISREAVARALYEEMGRTQIC